MKRFGYLHYEKTSGGRNERNTYHLKKLTPKVVNLHPETVQKLNGIESETVQKLNTGGSETEHAGVQKLNTQIPLEDYHLKEKGEASPSPCNSRASASPKKKEEASKEERVVIPFDPTPPSESPFVVTEEEKARRLKVAAELKRTLRGVSAR